MDCILIGYGYWGHIIERYIRQSEKFRLLGICDHHKEDGVDLQAVIDSIGCAFVCVPTRNHVPVVEELLAHGVHVFCEKPLCRSFTDTERLMSLAEEKNCVLFIDYIYMVSPSLQCMKEYLHRFGKVLYMDMAVRQFGRFYQREHVYETVGVHMLSVLAYLFEQPIAITKVDSVALDGEGYAQAGFLYFEVAGVRGRIECNMLAERKERTVRVLCEQGLLVFDMLGEHTIQVMAYEGGKDAGNPPEYRMVLQKRFDEGNNLTQMIDLFARTIEVGGEDNRKVTLITQRALEEIGRGRDRDEM